MPIHSDVESQRQDIARILASLFAMLGLTQATIPERIARQLHLAITRILRPAESAVRRLIVVMASRISPQSLAPVRAKNAAGLPRVLPAGLSGTGEHRASAPRFPLFDVVPRTMRARRVSEKHRPRLRFLDESYFDRFNAPSPSPPADDGMKDALHLACRLQAVKTALDNLPHQARRLARALARRQRQRPGRHHNALRLGRPPGFRQRPRHDIDRILQRCDSFAREALLEDRALRFPGQSVSPSKAPAPS